MYNAILFIRRRYTVDSGFIQQIADSAEQGKIAVIPKINPRTGDSIYVIEKSVVLTSHTHIVLDGCTLVLADGVYDGIFVSDGMWCGGVLTDTYEDIVIEGRDGAVLDGGVPNGLTEKTAADIGIPVLHNSFINLRGVKNFAVRGLHLTRGRYWGITLHYCLHGTIEDIDYDFANESPNQDGIDLRRGCSDIVIRNITGRCGDDVVALTALGGDGSAVDAESEQFPSYAVAGMEPHIHDVVIEKIHASCSGGHGIIRLLCHDGNRISGIRITDVVDMCEEHGSPKAFAAIRIGDVSYWSTRPAMPGELTDVVISGLESHAKRDILLADGCDAPVVL